MHSKMSWLVLALLVLGTAAMAQLPDPAFIMGGGPGGPAFQHRAGTFNIRFDSMDVAPVKGAPFCATVVTEHTQSLADGNRIHTNDTATLCRDSEGRTRREAGLNLLSAGQDTAPPKLINITDPVAGVRYLLDTENKIAQKMPLLSEPGVIDEPGKAHVIGEQKQVMIYQRHGLGGGDVMINDVVVKKMGPDSKENAPNTESLGDQTIEGIHATGTRMTSVIPAGKMGNEKPITVTSEKWYSPELKVTVMTKHNDPWAGELTTTLKSVNASEPDASLFAPPADYKVVDDKEGPIKIRLHAPGPPPQ
jgi:hypothetical protein